MGNVPIEGAVTFMMKHRKVHNSKTHNLILTGNVKLLSLNIMKLWRPQPQRVCFLHVIKQGLVKEGHLQAAD